jgi:hypothetical protein
MCCDLIEKKSGGGSTLGRSGEWGGSCAIPSLSSRDDADGALHGEENADMKLAELDDDDDDDLSSIESVGLESISWYSSSTSMSEEDESFRKSGAGIEEA